MPIPSCCTSTRRWPRKSANLISERTRVALARKKAQGAALGNRTNLPEARAKGAESNRQAATAFAANILPIMRQIEAAVRGPACAARRLDRSISMLPLAPRNLPGIAMDVGDWLGSLGLEQYGPAFRE